VPAYWGPCQTQSDAKVIAGAWRMTWYVRNQVAASLNGVLLLTVGRWSTLYFFRQPGRDGTWGSAESGRYRATCDQPCFHYEFKFQGARGKPLVIDLASTVVEVSKIVLTSEILEIYFPSGRVIHCRPYPE